MHTAKDIINELHKPTEEERKLITKAFSYTESAHEGHKRYSGEPYINHPAAVAYKLAAMGMTPVTICAGLLHDTIEDTPITSDDIRNEFGEEILFLVEGVTKLSSVRYYGTDRHNESLRKLFVATSQDIRVLIIKLTDRLHNMETLHHVPEEKQTRIARETLEIYVPVAHRLGMGKIRKELEDLAFPFVYPEDAKRVEELLKEHFPNAEEILEKERKVLQKKLVDAGLTEFKTSFRVKGKCSLYHKFKRKEWNPDRIYDLLAMRVIVSSVEDCYRTLGAAHDLWRPLPKRIKDYIAFPKPNGYQSIHTTVTTKNGTILEIQIRTTKMHQAAEFGVASHILYKPPTVTGTHRPSVLSALIPNLFLPSNKQTSSDSKHDIHELANTPPHKKIPRWISEIGNTYNQESDNSTSEFVADAESDFFSNRIFVFTPTGDVIDMPVGATPVDFAYAIHSEIGDHTASAKVNQKMSPLDTELKNGDMIEIETKKSANPSPKWLRFAKTSLARKHIKLATEDTL